MQVFKVGGSCLKTVGSLHEALDRLAREGPPAVVVVSALYGVTERLIAAAEAARRGSVATADIRSAHALFVDALPAPFQAELRESLDTVFQELERCLLGISYLGDISAKVMDRILSLGERGAVPVVATWLSARGLPSRRLVAEEAGILTTGRHGDASLLPEAHEKIAATLGGADRVFSVVAGFVGRAPDGSWTTLGRGGSDYTASAVAAALGCPLALLKDVPGLMTADPKLVPAARHIPAIHYLDALELAHYGLKTIQDKALLSAMARQIPIALGAVDGSAATVISGQISWAIAISCVQKSIMINLVDYGGATLKWLARLLDRLHDAAVLPLLLTEASPSGETSLVLTAESLRRLSGLIDDFKQSGVELRIQEGLSAVSVIGSGMKGQIGLAARVFEALAACGVNVVAIAQTASERNISVIVAEEVATTAVAALHRAFVEGLGAPR